MTDPAVLVSYFEVDSGRAVRLGSGPVARVLARRPHSAVIQVCVAEPGHEEFSFRLQFGTAQITEAGIIDNVPEDETERIGVPLPAMGAIMGAIYTLQALSEGQIEQIVSSETEWFLFRRDRILSACADAHRELGRQSSPWEPNVLIRLSGSPGQIREILAEMRDASETVDDPVAGG